MTNTPLEVAISKLTEPQASAVNWVGGPMLVLAGPGSGKTRVLTTRLAKLLADSPDSSFRVLALTFTNKAADEMSNRVTSLVPDQERRALVGTFHSFCMQMLQLHGSHIGINPDFAIYSLKSDREELLKDALREVGMSRDDNNFLSTIDKLKTKLIRPEGSATYWSDPDVGELVEKVYTAYESTLLKANALDFGSLILQAYQLVTTYPGIAIRYRKSYTHWMFDEFQDTTDGQYRLIKALAGDTFQNIFAVADDDQIIYQWNGASYQQLQKFRADFNPAEIQLPTNYRCPPSIVAAANNLVAHNMQRTESKLPSEAGKTELRYPATEHIRVIRYPSDNDEAVGIAQGISSIDKSLWGEVVVLARTRALIEQIRKKLVNEGVNAVIAQRRDEFISPQFRWLSATLRLALRPLDKRAFEELVGAFNRWFGTELLVAELFAAADLSSRTFLEEWVEVACSSSDNEAAELAGLAENFGKETSGFRLFIKNVLEHIKISEEDVSDDLERRGEDPSDVAEDRAAWNELFRIIGRTIGRTAPLEQFLQELAIRSKEPPIGPETVTLMTIHGSKGKEFDHVYFAGLAEDILPSFYSKKAGEGSPEMEEERRNCFVGITRASEWLCITYASTYRGWQKDPSRFIEEMGLEIPSDTTF